MMKLSFLSKKARLCVFLIILSFGLAWWDYRLYTSVGNVQREISNLKQEEVKRGKHLMEVRAFKRSLNFFESPELEGWVVPDGVLQSFLYAYHFFLFNLPAKYPECTVLKLGYFPKKVFKVLVKGNDVCLSGLEKEMERFPIFSKVLPSAPENMDTDGNDSGQGMEFIVYLR